MRRRRSETISAENFDEYLRLSQLPTSTSRNRARHSLPEPFLLSQAFIQNALNIPLETSKSSKNNKEKAKTATSTSYWDDIDFNNDEIATPATTTCSSISIHKGSMEEDEFDDLETHEAQVSPAKVMVVGAKNTGRHQLVNSFFGLPAQEGYEIATSLDLIVNKIANGNTSNLYKFWIKDALCQKFKHLFRVYHKSVSLFVFVYQVNNKASFECLSQAIEEIQKEIGPDFKGILIGGSPSNQESREVSLEEAEELRVKYGLSVSCEMDFIYNKEYQDHLQALLKH